MKEYYYTDGVNKSEPLSFQEIIEKIKIGKINSNTLIWYEGLDNWTQAKKIKDLNIHFKSNKMQNDKNKYKRLITIFILLFIVIIGILYFLLSEDNDYKRLNPNISKQHQLDLIEGYGDKYIKNWFKENKPELNDVKIEWQKFRKEKDCSFNISKGGFITANIPISFKNDSIEKRGIIKFKLSRNTFPKTLIEEVLNFTETKEKPPKKKAGKGRSNKSSPKKQNPLKKKPRKTQGQFYRVVKGPDITRGQEDLDKIGG